PAMGAEDDQVGALLDRVVRDTPRHVSLGRLVSVGPGPRAADLQPRRRFPQIALCLLKGSEMAIPMHGGGRGALKNMQEHHGCLAGGRQALHQGEHRLGQRGSIQGDEHSLVHLGSSHDVTALLVCQRSLVTPSDRSRRALPPDRSRGRVHPTPVYILLVDRLLPGPCPRSQGWRSWLNQLFRPGTPGINPWVIVCADCATNSTLRTRIIIAHIPAAMVVWRGLTNVPMIARRLVKYSSASTGRGRIKLSTTWL